MRKIGLNFVLFLSLVFAPSSCLGANYYVRSDAIGANNGSDWNNAYGQLPDVLERGVAYYIADGIYGRYTFDDPEDGSKYIYVKKAIETDHGTDIGWDTSYGDGQAIFINTVLTAPLNVATWLFTSGYYDVDGAVGVGPSNWNATCGFKLTAYSADIAKYGNVFGISLGTGSDIYTPDYINFSNIEIGFPDEVRPAVEGVWQTSYGLYCPLGPGYFEAHNGSQYINMSNCYLHDIHIPLRSSFSDHWVIENCYIARNYPAYFTTRNQCAGWEIHGGEDITCRYNLWEDIGGSGIIDLKMNVNDPEENYDGIYFYGNVCRNVNPQTVYDRTYGLGGGVVYIAIGTGITEGNASDILVYNNTFIDLVGFGTGIHLLLTPETLSGCYTYNNLWYNCSNLWLTQVAGHTWDYNWFIHNVWSDSEVNVSGPNGVLDADNNNPLINWQNKNFNLRSVVESGITLPSPYNRDMFGNVRGADGVWDRGAIEFTGENIEPEPEADGSIVIEKTQLAAFNNVIKAGGNNQAIVQCDLKEAGNLSVIVYDSKGKEIAVLFNGQKDVGRYPFTWGGVDSSNKKVGSGIYIVNMVSGSYSATKKIAVIK